MAIFRVYTKSEEAYADAAFLCGMGLNAAVFDERGLGGNALGASTSSIRVEVPDDQVAEASALIGPRPAETVRSAPAPAPAPVDAAGKLSDQRLARFLIILLLADIALTALFTFPPSFLKVKAPEEVENFLISLALSEDLWLITHHLRDPLALVAVVSDILCLFFLRFGRALFAFTYALALLSQLGPPPGVFGPLTGFLGAMQWTIAIIALSLMYWSPLRARFR